MTRNNGSKMKSSMLGAFAAVVMAFVMVGILVQFSYAEPSWTVTNDEREYVLTDGKATMTVAHNYTGGETVSYQWYDADDNEIDGATSWSYVATKIGWYECRVSIAGETLWARYYVGYSWKIANEYDEYSLTPGVNTVAITVSTSGTMSQPPSYQWYYWDDNSDDYIKIGGATGPTYLTGMTGAYKCEVKVGDEILSAYYDVYTFVDYYPVWIGDLKYELNSGNETSQAGVWEYRGTPSGSISIQDKVTLSNGKTYIVTRISDDLYGMEKVTQISIPATVTQIDANSIGYYAWDDYSETYLKVPGFTIIGTTGSAAHRYAIENGFAFRDLEAERIAREEAERLQRQQSITTVTVNTKTVNAATINNAIAAAGGSPQYVNKIVLGKKVKKISKKAFAGFGNITTLEVKTKKLKAKSVKDALKGSNIKTVKVKVGKKKENKEFIKKYKKIFTKKSAGRKVTVK